MVELRNAPSESFALAEPNDRSAVPADPGVSVSTTPPSEPETSAENPGSPGVEVTDTAPEAPVAAAPPDPIRSTPGAVAVATPGTEPSTTAPAIALDSLFTYTTLVTGPVSNLEEIQSTLIKRFPAIIQNGSAMTVSLSHSVWQQELPFLESLLSDNVVIETTPTDIALSIQTAQELVTQRKLELATFDQRLATLTVPADREQALRERAQLDQDLEDATESVLRLQEQVNMVIVTFQLTTTLR